MTTSPPNPDRPSTGAFDARASHRVVVVGRTGLEARLRLDPTVELVRVATGLDALSELASPVPGSPDGPTLVIVGQGTELEHAADGAARFVQFADAARRVDPGVLLFHTLDSPPSAAARFDGSLDPDATAEALRDLLAKASRSHDARTSDHPETDRPGLDSGALPRGIDDEVADESHEAPPHARGPLADEHLVQTILRGASIDGIATRTIAGRLGVRTARLLPAEADIPDQHTAVPVVHEGQLLGHLCVADAQADTTNEGPDFGALLEEHAAWLAPWLALAEQHRRLRVEAFTDPVTGAWNRRYFDRFVRTAIEHARKHRHKLTVMVFDVDDFKAFNDQFGHDAGDLVLAETVKLLKSTIRPSDRVCRIGGDEFAVVFYEPEGPRERGSDHPAGISQVAKRFQQKINDHTFPKLGVDAPGRLTISGGLATFPWDGNTAEEIIAHADQRALQSKRAGKNAITFGIENG